MALADFIFVTYNNPNQLAYALFSLGASLIYSDRSLINVIVINNGNKDSCNYPRQLEWVKVIDAPENLGWEGGLKLGLKESKAPFVVFCNDDIHFLTGLKDWFWRLMCVFNDPKVGAVGPCSNFVMGAQNVLNSSTAKMLNVKFLIGFFMIVRREALDRAGGIDDTLPGGDDIDLSMRMRDAGYMLINRRDVFIFHHGQQTGLRVHPDYWNTEKQFYDTDTALIKKHGMKKFWETRIIGWQKFEDYFPYGYADTDVEGELCRKHVIGDKILELGCGGMKTVENAVGIDIVPAGSLVQFTHPDHSVAKTDLVGDVSTGLPVPDQSQDTIIARHILEHCQDTLGTLSIWNKSLRLGGRLIIAVPNNELGNTILVNPEHLTTFVPSSLDSLARICGFERVELYRDVNGVSFVSVYEKVSSVDSRVASPLPTVSPKAARLEEAIA